MKLYDIQSIQTDSFAINPTLVENVSKSSTFNETLNPDDFKTFSNSSYNYKEVEPPLDSSCMFYTYNIYKCSYAGCPKVYKSRENMTLHFKNIHLGLKPYRCRFCSNTFSHRNGKVITLTLRKDVS
jgi:hypothetical protein